MKILRALLAVVLGLVCGLPNLVWAQEEPSRDPAWARDFLPRGVKPWPDVENHEFGTQIRFWAAFGVARVEIESYPPVPRGTLDDLAAAISGGLGDQLAKKVVGQQNGCSMLTLDLSRSIRMEGSEWTFTLDVGKIDAVVREARVLPAPVRYRIDTSGADVSEQKGFETKGWLNLDDAQIGRVGFSGSGFFQPGATIRLGWTVDWRTWACGFVIFGTGVFLAVYLVASQRRNSGVVNWFRSGGKDQTALVAESGLFGEFLIRGTPMLIFFCVMLGLSLPEQCGRAISLLTRGQLDWRFGPLITTGPAALALIALKVLGPKNEADPKSSPGFRVLLPGYLVRFGFLAFWVVPFWPGLDSVAPQVRALLIGSTLVAFLSLAIAAASFSRKSSRVPARADLAFATPHEADASLEEVARAAASKTGYSLKQLEISPLPFAQLRVFRGKMFLAQCLIDELPSEELHALIARELGQAKASGLVYRIWWLVIFLAVFLPLVGLWTRAVAIGTDAGWFSHSGGFHWLLDYLPAVLMGVLFSWFSERQAQTVGDRFAVTYTGDPELVIRSLKDFAVIAKTYPAFYRDKEQASLDVRITRIRRYWKKMQSSK